MGRKRKQQGGTGSAVPSTSKSSKLVGSSSASSAGRASAVGCTGGGSRSGQIAPSSNPGQEGFSGQLHPLMNPVVLSNLFSVCPLGLLATCRLVCKTWRNESLPAWRSSATPKITYSAHEGRLCVAVGKRTTKMSLTEFLQLWGNQSAGLPHQNLHLEVWEFDFGMRNGARVGRGSPAEQMLEQLGPHVKKLSLVNCEFGSAAAFRQVIYQSFPNLQSLVLQHPEVSNGIPEEQPGNNPAELEPAHGENLRLKKVDVCSRGEFSVPVSWVEFLSHFPALTSVEFWFGTEVYHSRPEFSKYERNLGLFLDAVNMIRRNDPRKLPELSLDIDPSLQLTDARALPIFNRIRQLGLHLGSFRISLNSNFNVAKNIIKAHGKRLTKIENYLDGYIFNVGAPINFPKMELSCLQELTLSDVFCKNMEFLKYTPNLGKLRIFNMPERSYDTRGGEQVPLETGMISSTSPRKKDLANLKLSTLKHLYFGYKLGDEDLPRLFNWFPKVESLTLFLNNERFAMVCENWPNLKHLHVLGRVLNDQGVTGLGGWVNRKEIKKGARRPNVTDLKELLCFVMESDTKPAICISDVSAREGFLKLPKLRYLDLSLYIQNFSAPVRKALEKAVDRHRIDHHFHGNVSNEMRDWCPDPSC